MNAHDWVTIVNPENKAMLLHACDSCGVVKSKTSAARRCIRAGTNNKLITGVIRATMKQDGKEYSVKFEKKFPAIRPERTPGYKLLGIMEATFSERMYETVIEPQFAEIEDDYQAKLAKGLNKRWLDYRANMMLIGTLLALLNPFHWVRKVINISKLLG